MGAGWTGRRGLVDRRGLCILLAVKMRTSAAHRCVPLRRTSSLTLGRSCRFSDTPLRPTAHFVVLAERAPNFSFLQVPRNFRTARSLPRTRVDSFESVFANLASNAFVTR